jgi:hypothetical protein
MTGHNWRTCLCGDCYRRRDRRTSRRAIAMLITAVACVIATVIVLAAMPS